MITHDTNALILSIYDTVTAPDTWNGMLQRIAETLGAKESNVFQGDAVNQELQSAWLSQGLDGIFDRPQYLPALREEQRTYHAIQDIVTESRLIASRDIQAEYHRRGYPPVDMSLIESILESDYGIRSRYTAPLNRQAHHYEFLTVHFRQHYDAPDFPRDGVALGDLLIPHMAKALEINRPFVLLQRRFHAVLEVLDRFRLAVMIAGPDYSVWLKNESARRVLERGDAFRLKLDGRLCGADPRSQRLLQACFSRLLEPDAHRQQRVKSLRQRIGDERFREPYVADFSVLSSTDLGTQDGHRGVLVVIVDPDRTGIINGDSVAELFRLTPAEAAVFSLVVLGHTNREVAEIRGVDVETVATQLKTVYAKTGCRRRGDLVHLAHSVNIPVDDA